MAYSLVNLPMASEKKWLNNPQNNSIFSSYNVCMHATGIQ